MCAAAAAASLQSCPTLCDTMDGSPPGSPVPGILQARTLEWVAISFSNAWKWKVKVKSLSPVRLFATPWTVAYQAPLSMGFPSQEYWSGVPLPSLDYIRSDQISHSVVSDSFRPHESNLHLLQVSYIAGGFFNAEPPGIPTALNISANLGNTSVATGLEEVSFHSNLKKVQGQRIFKLPYYCAHFSC